MDEKWAGMLRPVRYFCKQLRAEYVYLYEFPECLAGNCESLTNVIEPYRLRGGKPFDLPPKFDHPGIQGDPSLDVTAQEIEKFICFSDGLANPVKFNDAR